MPDNPGPAVLGNTPIIGSVRRSMGIPVVRDVVSNNSDQGSDMEQARSGPPIVEQQVVTPQTDVGTQQDQSDTVNNIGNEEGETHDSEDEQADNEESNTSKTSTPDGMRDVPQIDF